MQKHITGIRMKAIEVVHNDILTENCRGHNVNQLTILADDY